MIKFGLGLESKPVNLDVLRFRFARNRSGKFAEQERVRRICMIGFRFRDRVKGIREKAQEAMEQGLSSLEFSKWVLLRLRC